VEDEASTPLNIDVHAAIATVLGSLPEIRELGEQLSKLPGLQETLDELEDYAFAAGEANSRYVTALTPKEDIVALNEEAVKLRETFRLDAIALVHRGLVDPERLSGFTGHVGYKNVGFELIDWANVMRDSWKDIAGRTALTIEEVQHAKEVGEQLVVAAGHREQIRELAADAARIRQKALALLVRTYDEVRRGVHFVRWHEEDAGTLAPTLYAGRSRKRTEASEGEGGAESAAPAPGIAPGIPASPFPG
jgi:hypothetical protein